MSWFRMIALSIPLVTTACAELYLDDEALDEVASVEQELSSTIEAVTNGANASDHYRVEFKTWIPEQFGDPGQATHYIHDCEELFWKFPRPSWMGLRPFLCTKHDSYFPNDGHVGYDGTYRTFGWIEFYWNGSSISNFTHGSSIGPTTRHFKADITTYSPYCGTLGNICTRTIHSTQAYQQTCCVDEEKDNSTTFSITVAAANPYIPLSPKINAELIGKFTGGKIQIRIGTDNFPSYGVHIKRNGSTVDKRVVLDRSGISKPGDVLLRLNQYDDDRIAYDVNAPYCGDNMCTVGESHQSCSADCPAPPPPPPPPPCRSRYCFE